MAVWAIKLHDKVVKQFAIEDGERLIIGRGAEADVVVDNTAISRNHTAIEIRNGICFVEDLGSLNGTMVNGKKIDTCVQLFDNDLVEIGKFQLQRVEGLKEQGRTSRSAAPDYGDETVFVSRGAVDATMRAKGEGVVHRLVVTKSEASPSELVLAGRSSVKIGKELDSDLRVGGWFVARAQCYIINRDKHYYLVPQKSWVKTFVNGDPVREERRLAQGDVIRIRGVEIRFE